MPSLSFGTAIGLFGGIAGSRKDPYLAYRFHVEIDGLLVGGFQQIQGLQIETKVERFREGGRNDAEHVRVSYSTVPDLVLSRGMGDVDMLYGWYADVLQGRVLRKSLTITLLDDRNAPITYWDVDRAVPIKWEGPGLNAEQGQVAAEKLTLAHEGLRRAGTRQASGAAALGAKAGAGGFSASASLSRQGFSASVSGGGVSAGVDVDF